MENTKKLKIIAGITLFMLLFNMFSPFMSFINTSYAAVTIPKPAVVLRKNSDVQSTVSGTKYFTVQLAFVGNYIPKSLDFKFKFDNTKISMANKSNPDNDAALITLGMQQDGMDYGFTTQTGTATTYLNKSEGWFRLVAVGGMISPTDLGGMYGYDGYLPVYTFTFKFLDKSATTDDITTDLFELMPVDKVLPTGMKVIYDDGTSGMPSYTDPSYLKFDGFKEAAKKVKSIAVKNNPSKTTYDHGDSINLTGGNLLVTYTDDSTGTVSMTEPGVTIQSGNPANVNNPKVVVAYQGYTTEFDITVNDPVNKIEVTTPPTKTEYNQDETIELNGGVVTATTKSGKKSTINLPNGQVSSNVTHADLTAGEVTITGETPEGLQRGIQRVTLTYQGKTTKFDIIVNDTVQSISVQNPKTQYNYGDELDKSQGTIKVTTTSGASVDVPLSNGSANITGYKPNQLGSQQLTVTYLGKSATYNVNVNDYITGIEVKAPNKVNYEYGEEIDLTGGTVTDIYASGAKGSPESITEGMISGYNPQVTGNQTITVTKGGKTDTFEVNVSDKVSGIEVRGLQTEYKYGEQLDLTNAKVHVIMASGATQPAVNLTQDMIKTTFNANKVGQQTLTVEYQGQTTTVNVNVTDVLESIKVHDTEKPKDTYKLGETVNKTQGKIVATYKSGESKDIAISNSNIKLQNEDGTTFTTTGVTFETGETTKIKNMKISYTENEVEKTVIFPVTIINEMSGIKIQGTPKTQYNVNEEFEEGLEILVTRADGTNQVVSVTEDMVSGFDTSTEGTRTATITYTENGVSKQVTYQYTVTDIITEIKLLTQPNKTEYNYGENIDLTGATIEVTKGSGKTTIPVDSSMISEYNKNQLGEQQLTVTYGGKTATDKIIVNVNDYVTGIKVTPPTKTEYNKDEELDLAGGLVTKIMASGETGETTDLELDMITTVFDSNKPGPQELTVELDGFTDTFTVTVEDYIERIEIKETPKDKYNYGELIGTPGGKLNVIYKSGTEKEVSITPDMITDADGSPFDTTDVTFAPGETTSKKQVKVSYNGFEATYEITITNQIKEIRPQEEPKKDYVIGEAFEENLSILVERANGEIEAIEVTEDMVSGFDTSTEGKKQVTITYEENGVEKEYTYEINVTNPVIGMELEGTPKTEYIAGEELDVSGLNIVLHKPGGDERIPVTEDMASGYDKNKPGEQTVTITYNGQVVGSYKVNVANPVDRLEWVNKPKTSYVIGDELDVTGGQFKTIKVNGDEEIIDLTEEMVSGFDTSTKGIHTVTVTYEGKTLTYDINVADKVDKIEITKDPKKDYNYNEDLVAGGEITVTKASGETEVITITPEMITGYNKTELGNQTVTINYGGQTVDFELTVSDYVQDVIITPPSKVEYECGEDLDLSDSTVTVIMASTPDEPKVIQVTNDMITGYNKTKPGSQTVTISYTADNGKKYSKQFGVVVNDKITSVVLDKTNIKTEYKYGESLDLTNANLKVTFASGKTQTVPVNSGMISGYNPNKLGNQTVTVEYKGFKNTFNVTVKDYVKDIQLIPPTKTEYRIGESLSLAGGQITEIMASGAKGNSINLTPGMVTGFDSTTPGTKKLTVTYTKDGKTFSKNFEVFVENATNHIEIVPPTKTEYKYGEKLNLAGGKVVVVKDDGTKEYVDITIDMVSGYNPTQSGQQVVTVTYTDEDNNTFTGSFTVNVGEDYIVRYEFTAPSKTIYNIGEELDLTGGKITEIMASGNKGQVTNITKDMVSGYNPNKVGTQTVTVTHEGKTYTYIVTVEDEIVGISIKQYPHKLEYKKGETLDVTGGILNVVKTSGRYEVQITKDMVSGFDSNKSGIQVITIQYQGFTSQYIVYVKEDQSTTPSTDDKDDDSTTPSTNTDNNNSSNGNKVITIVKEENNEETQEEQENTQEEDKIIPPVVGSNDDNNNTPTDNKEAYTLGLIRGILATLIGISTLAGIILLIIVFAKQRKNVKIYIEEGNERVLVGKEKLTENNTNINLDKYYNKYKEDEYKIVLSKNISKKLDNKTVNLTVHDKQESFTVDYKNEEYVYRT